MYEDKYSREIERSSANSPLDEVCPIPDPLDSDDQWAAYYHRDLPMMNVLELKLEQSKLFLRLSTERPPDPWLLERYEAIERRLRHGG